MNITRSDAMSNHELTICAYMGAALVVSINFDPI